MAGEQDTGRRGIRRGTLALVVGGILLAALVAALVFVSRADRVARFALDRAGDALGLEITASGASEYRLRGTPTVVVRGVVARAPGAAVPVLTADRVLLSLPWSTLRGRMRVLDFTRIELDAPVLDLDALQDWLRTRPPGEGRVPTLRKGFAVSGGTLVAGGWRIEDLDLSVPALHADYPVLAHATGRYVAGATTLPFDLHGKLARPATDSALGVAGTATVERGGWRMPARIRMGGTWQSGDGHWGIARMKLGADATYISGETRARFAMGLAAPLRHGDGRTTLAPLHVSTIPLGDVADNPIPRLDGAGALAVAEGLELELDGTIARWPAAWPALPAPLGDAAAPTGFGLDYAGALALTDVARLALERSGATADARLRLPDITAWLDAAPGGSPLPPLDATASIPRLEIAGATLHGVELTLDDPAVGQAPGDGGARDE